MATVGTDSRWSWVIAAACCWVTFVIQGLVRCSGVVYVALIDAYGVNRAQASWPFTLRMAVWNLSGPVAGALSYKWSIRAITFTGVLLVTITNVVCWFAADISIVTLFLGGLQGLGVGMAVTLVPVIINQYFSKYKSTGAGIACAGATAGSFALPPIVEYAIEEYGLRGAFLMMAGITLHGVLGAALMRPAEWLERKDVAVQKNGQPGNGKCGDQNLNFLKSRTPEKLNTEEIKKLLKDVPDRDQIKPRSKSVRFNCNDEKNFEAQEDENSSLIGSPNSTVLIVNDKLKDLHNNECHQSPEGKISPVKYQVLPANSQNNVDSDTETAHYGKLEFIDNEPNYDPQMHFQTTSVPPALRNTINSSFSTNGVAVILSESPAKEKGCSALDSHLQKSKWFHGLMEPVKAACQILKHPMFLIIASNYSVFFLSYMTYLIVIVDYSLDLGVDRTDSVFLVSTFSIADLCGRLGSGWITDSGIIKRKNLMMGNMVTVGGLLIATSFTDTYMTVTAVSVCCGLVVGINLILFYALLEEYLGLKQLPMAVGLMNFSIGAISLVTPLLTGYFRDTMGSYDHLFHFLGSLSVLCGLLWLLEPLYSKCQKKRSNISKELGC